MAKKFLMLLASIVLAGCSQLPPGGSWGLNAAQGNVVIQTTPWAAGAATAGDAPAVAATETPAAVPAAGIRFPATVWRGGKAEADSRYDVTYDPLQGGSSDHPPFGWWWQPELPAPAEREGHEVALVLRGPANYRFTGPECRAWQNTDGKRPFDQGDLLIEGNGVVHLQPNNGLEVSVFVRCRGGAASGFSFEALTQLP